MWAISVLFQDKGDGNSKINQREAFLQLPTAQLPGALQLIHPLENLQPLRTEHCFVVNLDDTIDGGLGRGEVVAVESLIVEISDQIARRVLSLRSEQAVLFVLKSIQFKSYFLSVFVISVRAGSYRLPHKKIHAVGPAEVIEHDAVSPRSVFEHSTMWCKLCRCAFQDLAMAASYLSE